MKRLIYLLPVLALLAFGGLATQPVNAQNSYATWQGSFYNNAQLIDPPVYEATFNEINFDWGNGSPNPAVNADNFSARFGTDTFFEAGTYRFSITVDDGVQLLVDYNAVLNTYNSPRPGDTLTVDVTLTEGVHHLQVDYREITGNAVLKMSWINVNDIPTQPVASGNWTAQYYSNPTLSGTPFLTRTEASAPSYRYGLGAPLNGMPADNFSVRWSTTQNLPAGNYGIQVYADDGVRVFVNGVAYINEFHTFTGQGYTANFNLPGGATNIVVEYFESGFDAQIDFRLIAPTGTVNPGPTAAPTGATATVTAGVLNVRNAPSTTGTTILTKIRRDEVYPVTGTNGNQSWYRLNVGGVSGWVSGLFVNVSNTAAIPVVDGAPSAAPTLSTSQTATTAEYTATTISNLNLRAQPSSSSDSLLVIPRGGTAAVLARNSDSTWLKLNYQGVIGWSSARFVTVNPPLVLENIPVE
jgi:uncharacterized protein YraI